MNVPPFVPPPIEIRGNVAEEAHAVRLRFIRTVVAMYAVSILVVVGASFAAIEIGQYDLVAILASLLLLSAVRAVEKGRPIEPQISLAVSVILFLSLGEFVHRCLISNWPIWALLVGVACLVVYTYSCGRDLSFMGMWGLSVVVSTVLIFGLGRFLQTPLSSLGIALAANAAFITYWVYDLAALQTRRRLGEEVGAVLDLYRDVLNMFSYPIRVWNHWRTHKIWSA